MKYIVSACLMGDNCKYNGGNNYNEDVINFLKDKEYIKVCPEVFGGLKTPRVPSEIVFDKVINQKGLDVTNEYLKGAYKTLQIIKDNNIKCAILKSRSPSCGTNQIYDGTFSKTLKSGDGITAKLLKENGISVFSELELEKIKEKDDE